MSAGKFHVHSPLQFSITIKDGTKTLAYVKGREFPCGYFTMDQVKDIIELEAKLEQLTGLRFHINQER